MKKQITITGLVGAMPRLITFPSGLKVAQFNIALPTPGNRFTPLWVDVDCWGDMAERVLAAITTRTWLTLTGELSIKSYFKLDADGCRIPQHKPVLKLTDFHPRKKRYTEKQLQRQANCFRHRIMRALKQAQ